MDPAPETARSVFVIRHGEKPGANDQPPCGVDLDGNRCDDSLVPVGWQRAGAIAQLFRREGRGLAVPTRLVAPSYGKPDRHRTHQTILPLSLLLDLSIESKYEVGQEEQLGAELARATSGVTLVCWEHHRIPAIAGSLAPGAEVPQRWPDDRFDMVWAFERDPEKPLSAFTQIPEMLLPGDSEQVFPRSG
ncbi:MAG TPA: hypothetical protein VF712_06590 [Thermoleophilaceae bacterium]|jgi:hypothetical protein